MTKAQILKHFEPLHQIVVETDACNFTMNAGLSQVIDGQLHPIVFYSTKMDKAVSNYDIHD